MAKRAYAVRAQWDGEAEVWTARSDDVPSLVAEAETPEGLVAELKLLVPELLELNCGIVGPAEVSLV